MDRESCVAVLVERLGADAYSALTAMTDEREDRLLRALGEGFAAVDRRFEAIDRKFDAIDRKFEAIDQKFIDIDRQFLEVNHRFDVMNERLERRLAGETGKLQVEMASGFGAIRTDMANQRADLMKWAMVYWVSQAAAVAGIVAVLT